MKFIRLNQDDLKEGGILYAFSDITISDEPFPDANDTTPNEPTVIMSPRAVDNFMRFASGLNLLILKAQKHGLKLDTNEDKLKHLVCGFATLYKWSWVAFTGKQVILKAEPVIVNL